MELDSSFIELVKCQFRKWTQSRVKFNVYFRCHQSRIRRPSSPVSYLGCQFYYLVCTFFDFTAQIFNPKEHKQIEIFRHNFIGFPGGRSLRLSLDFDYQFSHQIFAFNLARVPEL